MSRKLSSGWWTECLITKFPMFTQIHVGHRVKLEEIDNKNIVLIYIKRKKILAFFKFILTKFAIFFNNVLFSIRCWGEDLVQINLLITNNDRFILQILLWNKIMESLNNNYILYVLIHYRCFVHEKLIKVMILFRTKCELIRCTSFSFYLHFIFFLILFYSIVSKKVNAKTMKFIEYTTGYNYICTMYICTDVYCFKIMFNVWNDNN